MSEHTPTTEEVRARHAARDTAGFDAGATAFDRWLAAHDAEVRASVVAEEPEIEWEYGMQDDYGLSHAKDIADAYDHADRQDSDLHPLPVRRRKAGEWMPIEEGVPDAF